MKRENFPLNHPIETQRLYIRPVSDLDAPFFVTLMNCPNYIKYIGDRNIHTTKQAKEYIKVKMEPQRERLGFTNNVVILKEMNTPIGICGLFDRESNEGFDIGFAFLPQFEAQGYGYESASALMERAKLDPRIDYINAITLPINLPSQKLILKLGLEFRKSLVLEGETETVWQYGKKL